MTLTILLPFHSLPHEMSQTRIYPFVKAAVGVTSWIDHELSREKGEVGVERQEPNADRVWPCLMMAPAFGEPFTNQLSLVLAADRGEMSHFYLQIQRSENPFQAGSPCVKMELGRIVSTTNAAAFLTPTQAPAPQTTSVPSQQATPIPSETTPLPLVPIQPVSSNEEVCSALALSHQERLTYQTYLNSREGMRAVILEKHEQFLLKAGKMEKPKPPVPY